MKLEWSSARRLDFNYCFYSEMACAFSFTGNLSNAVLTLFFVDAKMALRCIRDIKAVLSFIHSSKTVCHGMRFEWKWLKSVDWWWWLWRAATLLVYQLLLLGVSVSWALPTIHLRCWGVAAELLQWLVRSSVRGTVIDYSRVIHSVNNWALSWTVARLPRRRLLLNTK